MFSDLRLKFVLQNMITPYSVIRYYHLAELKLDSKLVIFNATCNWMYESSWTKHWNLEIIHHKNYSEICEEKKKYFYTLTKFDHIY